MRKFIYPLLATGALLSLTGCASDEPIESNPNDGSVTFKVSLPEMGTRAFGDAGTINCDELVYTVFDSDGTAVILPTETRTAFGKGVLTDNVTLQLVANQNYKIVFYAHNSGSAFSSYTDGKLSVDYSKANVNSELDDAFYASYDFTADGTAKSVTLSRPFAQLNIGTDDLDNAAVAKILSGITTTLTVSQGLQTGMNLLTGATTSEGTSGEVSFTPEGAPSVNTDFPVPGYSNLLSVYLLVPSEQDIIDATYVLNNGDTEIRTLNLSATPVRMNYRTNVYGSLLTSQNSFNVVIEPNFEKPDFEVTFKPENEKDLSDALSFPGPSEIQIDGSIDASNLSPEDLNLEFPKKIVMAPEATLTLASSAYFTTSKDLTIEGGTITNETTTRAAGDPSEDGSKGIFRIYGGNFTLDGVTLINDMDYHFHGKTTNSAAIAYWNDANITINNSTVKSGEFTLCGMGRGVASGVITLNNSYFESNSSNVNNGKNWSYALRLFGTEGTVDNCTVKGIQGGLSTDGGIKLTINSGLFYTYNSPGKQDAFYPLYITDGSQVTINGGYFYGAMKRANIEGMDGNSCVVAGDNDISLPSGTAIINGGYFNGKAYNEGGLIVLPTGKSYQACDVEKEGMKFTWTVN